MTRSSGGGVYERLGVLPVINLWGSVTGFGGFVPSPAVEAAMNEANERYVDMMELATRAGEHIAEALGTEAAFVSPGGIAGLVNTAMGLMCAGDVEKIMRVPDTAGWKDEFVVQASNEGAERAYELGGGRLVYAGDESGCTPEQLEAAIGPQTAAVTCYFEPDTGQPQLPVEKAMEIAHGNGLPVVVDAAVISRPVDEFRRTAQTGDVVSFGGKYFGGPSASGFVCGKKELIDQVALIGCYTGEHLGDFMPPGRAHKMDRMQIVGLVVALDEWLAMDHEKRLRETERRLSVIQDSLDGVAGVRTEQVRRKGYDDLVLLVRVGPDARTTGDGVIHELDAGSPSIKIRRAPDHWGTAAPDEDGLIIRPHSMLDGEERTVGERLRSVLGG